MIIFTDKTIPNQPPENDFGNKEYKQILSPIVKKKKNGIYRINMKFYIEKKAGQMLFRLIEGKGKAVYILGIKDNGIIKGMTEDEMDETLKNFKLICQDIGAIINKIRVYYGGVGYVCTARVYLLEHQYLQKTKNLLL
jgi:GTPase